MGRCPGACKYKSQAQPSRVCAVTPSFSSRLHQSHFVDNSAVAIIPLSHLGKSIWRGGGGSFQPPSKSVASYSPLPCPRYTLPHAASRKNNSSNCSGAKSPREGKPTRSKTSRTSVFPTTACAVAHPPPQRRCPHNAGAQPKKTTPRRHAPTTNTPRPQSPPHHQTANTANSSMSRHVGPKAGIISPT